jgi:hypothetical protein
MRALPAPNIEQRTRGIDKDRPARSPPITDSIQKGEIGFTILDFQPWLPS